MPVDCVLLLYTMFEFFNWNISIFCIFSLVADTVMESHPPVGAIIGGVFGGVAAVTATAGLVAVLMKVRAGGTDPVGAPTPHASGPSSSSPKHNDTRIDIKAMKMKMMMMRTKSPP